MVPRRWSAARLADGSERLSGSATTGRGLTEANDRLKLFAAARPCEMMRAMRITPAFVVVSLLCATAACGSSVTEDEDGSGGGAAASTGAATSTASSTVASTVSGATATAATAGGSNPTGQGPGSGGSGEGGDISTGEGGFSEGGGGPGPGAGGSSSSGNPVMCGQIECDADEVCCGTQQGLNCIGAGDPCMGATITCQNASDCEGDQVCCLTGSFQDAEAACADACEETPLGPLQLCETEEECVEDVPCTEAFMGFKICGEVPGGPGGPGGP